MLPQQILLRQHNKPCWVVGVMSGTSLDGVDLALCQFSGSGFSPAARKTSSSSFSVLNSHGQQHDEDNDLLLHNVAKFETFAIPDELRSAIRTLFEQNSRHSNASSRKQEKNDLTEENVTMQLGQEEDASLLELVCRIHTDWSRCVARMICQFLSDKVPFLHRAECPCSASSHDSDIPPRPLLPRCEKEEEKTFCFCWKDHSVAVASHGQTIWHHDARTVRATAASSSSSSSSSRFQQNSTLQLGDSEVLAQLTQCAVVANFRSRDVAVGGVGAPLVPYFDQWLASRLAKGLPFVSSSSALPSSVSTTEVVEGHPSEAAVSTTPLETVRAVAFQNLGGIGNVAVHLQQQPLQQQHCSSSSSPLHNCLAFDTGPANVMLNEVIEEAYRRYRNDPVFGALFWSTLRSGDEDGMEKEGNNIQDQEEVPPSQRCDKDALFSSLGRVRRDWLRLWEAQLDRFLFQQPPKSTGREQLGISFVREHCIGLMIGTEDEEEKVDESSSSSEKEEMPTAAKWDSWWQRKSAGSVTPPSSSSLRIAQRLCDLCRTCVAFAARSVAISYWYSVLPWCVAHHQATEHLPQSSSQSSREPTAMAATGRGGVLGSNIITAVLSGGGARHPLLVQDITVELQQNSDVAQYVAQRRCQERCPLSSCSMPLEAHKNEPTGSRNGEHDGTTWQFRVTLFDDLFSSSLPHTQQQQQSSPTTSAPLISLSDAKEAIAFAMLGHEMLNACAGVFRGEGTNVRSATGAKQGVVLGQLSVP